MAQKTSTDISQRDFENSTNHNELQLLPVTYMGKKVKQPNCQPHKLKMAWHLQLTNLACIMESKITLLKKELTYVKVNINRIDLGEAITEKYQLVKGGMSHE